MKKLKFSIITVSIALSFGLFAEEVENSLYDKAKTEALTKQTTSTELRSTLRNQETLTGLENKALDAEIDKLNKEIELKKLLHTLKTVPVEYLDDPEGYYKKKEMESKKVDISSLYPSMRDKTDSFNVFPKETYDIDQLIAIPELERQKKPRNVQDSGVKIITQDEINNKNKFINTAILPENNQSNLLTEIDSVDVDMLKENIPDTKSGLDLDIGKEFDGILTEEEKSKLAAIYNSDSKDIINTQKDGLKDELKKIEETSVFSNISSLSIDGIYIFGDNKSADLSLSFYVGDGIEGEEFDNKFKEIKENQIISVKGFKYKIKNISFEEVEIENLEDGEIYIASKSLRNIE
jgi:hypothetical protein